MANSLIEAYKAEHPGTWRDLFRRYRPPTALELATSSLEECRREQLNQHHHAEQHSAQAAQHNAEVKMLMEREKRLIKDIQRLSSKGAAVSTLLEEKST